MEDLNRPQIPELQNLENELLSLFEEAATTSIKISADEAVYDLNYISEKLAACSANQERLSEIQFKLTRTSSTVC